MDKVCLILPGDKTPEPGFAPVVIDQLPDMIDASCIELHVGNLLERVNPGAVIDLLFKKVRLGGKIRFMGTDICAIATDLVYGIIEPSHVRQHLAGRNLYSIQEIIDMIESHGFVVVSKKFVENNYIVEGER